MNYELFIGRRYLFSPRRDRSISLITWISICGVALGVIALVVSTSVMNGFRTNLQNAVTGSLPHITVFSWGDQVTDFEALRQRLLEQPEVTGAGPYVYKQALLTGGSKPKGALLRGIDPQLEPEVTSIADFLRDSVYGLPPEDPQEQKQLSTQILKRIDHTVERALGERDGLILGAMLAQQMEVRIGDTVQVVSSEQRMTPVGDVPRVKKLEVVGIFESGISGYDEVLAFADYRLVQKLFGLKDRVTGIGLRIKDPEEAAQVAQGIRNGLKGELFTSNWADENKSLFQVMKLEKIGLFLILTLIIVVAAFNIISSLVMLVLEKSREVAILKALGASDGGIRRIFMFQGVVIGLLGTLSGVLLGLGICWGLQTFDIIDIPPGVYPGGNRIPVRIDWQDVGLTTLSSFLICFLVTLYPSTKAARLNPVDPLRYE
jgi:lipoprotein-releasing system permease protein